MGWSDPRDRRLRRFGRHRRSPGDPAETKSSKPWLDLIETGDEGVREHIRTKADGIDKIYADLERLATVERSREFQMFWANIACSARRSTADRRCPLSCHGSRIAAPLMRQASELLERTAIVALERENIDGLMKQLRDDLVIVGRGVPWLRYLAKGDENSGLIERVCLDYVDRKDYLHDPARTWKEVGWVGQAVLDDRRRNEGALQGVLRRRLQERILHAAQGQGGHVRQSRPDGKGRRLGKYGRRPKVASFGYRRASRNCSTRPTRRT